MTDNEIVNVLECFTINDFDKKRCVACPFRLKDCDEIDLPSLALDLVNRQKAEIENFKLLIQALNDVIVVLEKDYVNARVEAIEEFAERLTTKIVNTPFGVNCTGETESYKEGCLHGLVAKQNNVLDMIANLAKEMTEVDVCTTDPNY